MAKRPRRNHGTAFKAKVALEAIKGIRHWWNCQNASNTPQPDSRVEEKAFRKNNGGLRQREVLLKGTGHTQCRLGEPVRVPRFHGHPHQ